VPTVGIKLSDTYVCESVKTTHRYNLSTRSLYHKLQKSGALLEGGALTFVPIYCSIILAEGTAVALVRYE